MTKGEPPEVAMTGPGEDVKPPVGVVMHDKANSRSFGLKRMSHGEVADNVGPGESHLVNGTILFYEPELVRVEATRRDLSAEQINSIGELSKAIYNQFVLDRYLNEIKGASARALDGLRLFMGASAEFPKETTSTAGEDAKSTELITQTTGIVPSNLEERQKAITAKTGILYEEARSLGVTVIRVRNVGFVIPKPPQTPASQI